MYNWSCNEFCSISLYKLVWGLFSQWPKDTKQTWANLRHSGHKNGLRNIFMWVFTLSHIKSTTQRTGTLRFNINVIDKIMEMPQSIMKYIYIILQLKLNKNILSLANLQNMVFKKHWISRACISPFHPLEGALAAFLRVTERENLWSQRFALCLRKWTVCPPVCNEASLAPVYL